MAGIQLGSSFRLSSPVPHLANATFADAPTRLAAGQLRHVSWRYSQDSPDAHYRIKPLAVCFLADGVTPATQFGTWGTLESHWRIVPITADDLPESAAPVNKYYTDARSALKADLVNGVVPASQLPPAATSTAPAQATATTLGTVKGGGTGNVVVNSDGSMTATAAAAAAAFASITGAPADNTALSTALGLKVDKVTGLALSSNDYTSPEKAKLAALIMPANTDALSEGLTNKYFTDPRAVAAKLTGYVKPAATRPIAGTDAVGTALGLLESGLLTASAPLVGILPAGLVGYATLNAALADRSIYAATNLTINTSFVVITASNTFQYFPAYFDAKGATVVINDGVTLAFPLQDITRFSINNTFFIQQNTTASTAIIDFLNNGNAVTPAVEQLGQVFNTFSQIPYRLNNNTLSLNNGYCVSVLGTGTLYLFGNVRVGTVAAGVTVIDRRTAPDTFSVLPPLPSITIDFNTETVRTLTITTAGSVTFTGAANIALLKTKELYISNTSGAAIALSFTGGWSFFPGPAPTSLAAGKQAVLTLRSLGTTDATIKAAYVAQA